MLTLCSSEDWRAWLINQLLLTTYMSSRSFFQRFHCLSSQLAGDQRVLEQMGSFAIYLVGCGVWLLFRAWSRTLPMPPL